MKSVLSLSHIDMDGTASQVVLKESFGDVTILNCNYDKIKESLSIIGDMLDRTSKFSHIFVTDLHFSESDFTMLLSIANRNKDKEFIYIDHHDYEFEPTTFASLNLKVIKSNQFSATKLTYGYIKKNYGFTYTAELRHFIDCVDAYDLWRKDNPLFSEGLILNEIFWSIGIKRFFIRFKDSQELRNSDRTKYVQWMEDKRKYFDRLNDRGMLFKTENKSIFCGFIDEYRSHITLDFSEYLIHVNVTKYGNISIRVGDSLDDVRAKYLKDRLVAWLVSLPKINSAGGHIKAMGAKAVDCSAEELVQIAQQLTITIDAVLEHELKLYSGTGEMTF